MSSLVDFPLEAALLDLREHPWSDAARRSIKAEYEKLGRIGPITVVATSTETQPAAYRGTCDHVQDCEWHVYLCYTERGARWCLRRKLKAPLPTS